MSQPSDTKRLQVPWPDLALVAGLALVSYGFHLAWAPLGFIVPGLLLLAIALMAARAEAAARGTKAIPE